jgi:hypothetical protein
MSSKHKRILNLIVILGLLLVMLPQRSTTAQPVKTEMSPTGVLEDPSEMFRRPYAGPEKELNSHLQANGKLLNIAGWHFRPYFERCEGLFTGFGLGQIRPVDSMPDYCWITYPLLLPSGTTIDWVFFNFYDNDPSRDLAFFLHRFNDVGSEWDVVISLNEIEAGAPGYDFVGTSVNHEVQMYDTYNFVVAFPEGADYRLLFSSVNILYKEPGVFGLGFPAIQK